MADYPAMIAQVNQVEPVPRRIRGFIGDTVIMDSTRALYVWEWANYPQYYFPLDDVRMDLLVDEDQVQHTRRGPVRRHGIRVGDVHREGVARLLGDSSVAGLTGTVRFEWSGLDRWFEEDEEVFLHPRNPYVRVDALRSTRTVRVELDGAVLAESGSPVLVFETGLPTRYYLPRTEVRFARLRHTDTVTVCPYKGFTSDYWSVVLGETVHQDLAWSYNFPAGALLPIAGLVAFYNEKVDIVLDGVALERPKTHLIR
ncbi:MAG TPA: DUF427 domain-containing protein [Pseudonocardiaceae bacterium]|nr:DUF427 domain-containing protein [Pseudonocardiaceae bacterium]